MSERDQSHPGTPGTPGSQGEDWREQTTPGIQPVGAQPAGTGYGGATTGGYGGTTAGGYGTDSGYGSGTGQGGAPPGQSDASSGWPGAGRATAPEYSTRPVTVRRADTLASLLLILAGIAAAVSLLLRWLPGSDLTGWDLVRRGFDDLEQGLGELVDTGFWQPMAVILGGGVLFVLGLLVVLPAKTHRLLGVLALLVSLLAAAGVLVPLADTGWDLSAVDTGFWFAVAVPTLGLLGALKALLTGPKRR
ncbi:hypothetical protein GCU56_09290 [Geodermatophilus sabuli]|uniref:Uncharacterized protein n=1 Tax=Geodermatophilus sabuli TaxID=1564158 RepID=A0A7K3VZL3_9ACTN|nr:hypothetical protein [Geodermatophilus sabuli]NEK58066.1 hypothetical protein [Geodermatophilus sabuli]